MYCHYSVTMICKRVSLLYTLCHLYSKDTVQIFVEHPVCILYSFVGRNRVIKEHFSESFRAAPRH